MLFKDHLPALPLQGDQHLDILSAKESLHERVKLHHYYQRSIGAQQLAGNETGNEIQTAHVTYFSLTASNQI